MSTLHKLFVQIHAQYTTSPYSKDLSDLADWLLERRYSVGYVQRHVFVAKRVMTLLNLPPGSSWSCEQLDQGFEPFWDSPFHRSSRRTMGVFLQSVGRLIPSPVTVDPHGEMLMRYRAHLCEFKALLPITADAHIVEVRGLLNHALPLGKALADLSSDAIERYIKKRARTLCRSALYTCIRYLSAFLRYGLDIGLIRTPLHELDRPVRFSEELPPKALEWSLIQKLLDSVDRSDRSGWRDFMMLHLMAYYGLRPGEVALLKEDSINWKDRSLVVEQPKTRTWLILPLMDDTLNFLKCFLKESRRPVARPELFSSVRAPYGLLTGTNMTTLFKRRVRKSGLPIAPFPPYVLRHSFAMRLFDKGVGIKTIGDLMGHSSIESTSVYLRLQVKALLDVALPVPTEEVESAQ